VASICSLRTLRINTEFILNSDPPTWNNSPDYEANENIIMALKVVNDCAERGVKIMSKYNTSRTKDELQLQNLLHVVEDHSKRVIYNQIYYTLILQLILSLLNINKFFGLKL
jgi:hypothetical protein